ncbi:MAG: hypothetical protein U0401_11915 [Anaerolineae bacterium]
MLWNITSPVTPVEKLNSLPMAVEEPATAVNPFSVIGILGFIGIIGCLTFFRNSRQPQGGGNSSYNFSNMGRSNPRIIGNTNKDDKTKPTLKVTVTVECRGKRLSQTGTLKK